MLSSRIWPARDYTRLTLESKSEIKHSIFALKDPERLVLELQTDELSPALAELQGKVSGDDPYIQGLRVGLKILTFNAKRDLVEWKAVDMALGKPLPEK